MPASSPATVDVALTGTQETLLITLYAKWFDFYSPKPILADRWAAEAMDRISDADGSLHKKLQHTPTHAAAITLRARLFDTWATEFLAENPTATVLHLACGLDARALRLRDKCGPRVRWIDVDMPEVIDLRRRLDVPEPAAGDRTGGGPEANPGDDDGYTYKMVASSVTEEQWLEEIPADRPTLVIAEGLTMYLTPQTGEHLIKRLAERFPSGQLMFDCLPTANCLVCDVVLWFKGHWDFRFTWAIDSPKSLERLHPRLKLRDLVYMWNVPGLDRLSRAAQTWIYLLSWVPIIRSFVMFARYKF